MKKIFLVGLVGIFTFALTAAGFCATSGNPNDIQTPHGPGLLNMEAAGMGYAKIGADVEFFEKDIDGVSGTSSGEMEGNWYLGKISYNIANRLDVFAVLGTSDLELKWSQGGTEAKIEGDSAFAWGVGGKLFIYEFPDWGIRLSANGLFRSTEPDVDKAKVAGADVTSTATAKEFDVREWHLGLNVSKEFKLSEAPEVFLVPYFGVRYADSDVDAKFTDSGTVYNLGGAENDDVFGIVVGGDLLVGNNLSLNLEGRFIDETALSLGLTIRL